jgi:hypothetical protein
MIQLRVNRPTLKSTNDLHDVLLNHGIYVYQGEVEDVSKVLVFKRIRQTATSEIELFGRIKSQGSKLCFIVWSNDEGLN